ncbi:MAG: Na(+)/H(+) antiporter subunit B [Clostridiales bacterium]|nr:Na(+)/H(+) antiporter subunit B [Clostridiales bacterium]
MDANKIKFKRNNLIYHRVVQGLFFFIFLFSIYIFWVGHNAPGGGFIGGLMSAIAVVLLYLTFASRFQIGAILSLFKYFIALGLAFAVGCGLGATVFGYPFLTHTFGYFSLPFFGSIELATAVIFDIGVYLTVVGTVLVIVISIGNHGYDDNCANDKKTT